MLPRVGKILGYLGCLALSSSACTQDVDDPANFDPTQGQGTGAASDSSDGGDDDSPGMSGAMSNSGDSSTGAPLPMGDSSTGEITTGPTNDDDGNPQMGCGDGMVSPGEQCDGANLQGFDCASLGLGSGTLGCDPVTCTFDTSMCMGGGGSGTSG